jgi:bacillithiol biosynthesis deacetylase BshB1
MKLDLLAFAAHPDDVELACSGTLIRHIQMGKKAGIVDLTRGELGTRGSAEIRQEEANAASKIMGLSSRDNLGFADGFFENNREHQLEIIKKIRLYQPEIILANAPSDRHPDHGRAAALLTTACFLAGLVKIETAEEGLLQKPWRPKAVYHYIQDRYLKPDFIIDITEVFELKMQVIKTFDSQFYKAGSTAPVTAISTPEFLEYIVARAQHLGRDAGVKYAEGFVVERVIGLNDLFQLI